MEALKKMFDALIDLIKNIFKLISGWVEPKPEEPSEEVSE